MTPPKKTFRAPVTLAGHAIPPGSRHTVHLPLADLHVSAAVAMPVHVVHGSRPGPSFFLCAAIHGDEINGVAVIRDVLARVKLRELRGVLYAVPVVNPFALISQSRRLPDGRDLNRSFPGTANGSLASCIAHCFMTEIVERCSHGIDLHTGSLHRTNLPQIRADLTNAETRRCAEAFGAPVMLNARQRDGSLREAAKACGVHLLVYEAGEPLRFSDDAVRQGAKGVLRVMAAVGMRGRPAASHGKRSLEITRNRWVRAHKSGVLYLEARLGDWVRAGDTLGVIVDVVGQNHTPVSATSHGLVIGHTKNPLVHRGDAVVHIAQVARE